MRIYADICKWLDEVEMVRAEKLVPGTGIRSLHLRDMQPVRTVPHTICSPICTYAAVRRPYAVKPILIVSGPLKNRMSLAQAANKVKATARLVNAFRTPPAAFVDVVINMEVRPLCLLLTERRCLLEGLMGQSPLVIIPGTANRAQDESDHAKLNRIVHKKPDLRSPAEVMRHHKLRPLAKYCQIPRLRHCVRDGAAMALKFFMLDAAI